ncbi:MAG: BamA/TamA family outer membrane protein [Deltaproteobacteria bacterium]|nr:BamA/TamA family outer membrane protein [Deltaproteobacteria bacterium]
MLPIAFYTDETSLAFGGMVVRAFRWPGDGTEVRPSSMIGVAFYTLRSQYNLAVSPSLYLRDGRYLLRFSAAFNEWPSTFWGVGRGVSDEDEEDFNRRTVSLDAALLRRFWGPLRAGPAVDLSFTTISDVETGGFLAREAFRGSRGGDVVGAGGLLEWDTRDQEFWPTSGAYHTLRVVRYVSRPLGEFPFTRITVDLRGFVSPWRDHVLATQVTGVVTHGRPPFFRLAEMGGPVNMRGLYEGRFRDRNLVTAQVEYRVPLGARFAGVLFAGAGEVAPSLRGFGLRGILVSGGAGLRFALDPENRMNLRLDVGVSRFGAAPIVTVNEAF